MKYTIIGLDSLRLKTYLIRRKKSFIPYHGAFMKTPSNPDPDKENHPILLESENPFKNSDLTSHNIFVFTKETLDQLPPKLGGWIELYLHLQMEGVRAPRTVESVKLDLKKFLDFFTDYMSTDDISRWSPQITQRFMEHLKNEWNLKPATISRILTSLRSFSKWVHNNRPDFFSLGNPTLRTKPPVQDALQPKALTKKQTRLLLDAAQNLILKKEVQELSENENLRASIYRPKRDYAILTLLLYTGLRREEICNLTLEQLQGKRLVNVKCKGNKYRNLFIGEASTQAIQDYLGTERPGDAEAFNSSNLFLPPRSRKRGPGNGQLSTKAIERILEKLSREASAHLPEDQKFLARPHMLRHTHAYRLLEKGKSESYIKERLGHQTMNYVARYTKMPESEEMALIDSLEEV